MNWSIDDNEDVPGLSWSPWPGRPHSDQLDFEVKLLDPTAFPLDRIADELHDIAGGDLVVCRFKVWHLDWETHKLKVVAELHQTTGAYEIDEGRFLPDGQDRPKATEVARMMWRGCGAHRKRDCIRQKAKQLESIKADAEKHLQGNNFAWASNPQLGAIIDLQRQGLQELVRDCDRRLSDQNNGA